MTGPLSDLEFCNNRKVYILLDSNVTTNPKVQDARNALIRELSKTERNCTVLICDLPVIDNANGPDDYVRERGDDAMVEVFAKAHPPAKAQQPSGRQDEPWPEPEDQGWSAASGA